MKKCEKCQSTNIIGIEYDYLSPYHYDGISEWRCEDCGYRINRFTGQELKEGEIAKWR
jgi:transposase-like protein